MGMFSWWELQFKFIALSSRFVIICEDSSLSKCLWVVKALFEVFWVRRFVMKIVCAFLALFVVICLYQYVLNCRKDIVRTSVHMSTVICMYTYINTHGEL